MREGAYSSPARLIRSSSCRPVKWAGFLLMSRHGAYGEVGEGVDETCSPNLPWFNFATGCFFVVV